MIYNRSTSTYNRDITISQLKTFQIESTFRESFNDIICQSAGSNHSEKVRKIQT